MKYDDADWEKYKKAQQAFDEGIEYYRQKKYEDAFKKFDESIAIRPSNDFYDHKIKAYIELKKIDEAILFIDDAIGRGVNNEKCWFKKGLIFYDAKNYETAIQCFNQVLTINPKNAVAINNIGECYNKLEKYKDAIIFFDKAIELSPLYSIAWTNKGYSLDKLLRFKEASNCHEKAIFYDINNNTAYNNLTFSLMHLPLSDRIKSWTNVYAEKHFKWILFAPIGFGILNVLRMSGKSSIMDIGIVFIITALLTLIVVFSYIGIKIIYREIHGRAGATVYAM